MSDQNPPEQPPYRPGDVVNGWLLTEGGEWVPATQPPTAPAFTDTTAVSQAPVSSASHPFAPQATPKKKRKKWPWIVAAAVVVVILAVVNVADQIISNAITTAREESTSSTSSDGGASAGDEQADEGSVAEDEPVAEEEPEPEPVDLSTFGEVDAATWAAIAADANAHVGKQVIVYAEVTQYDSYTGADSVRANVGATQPGGEYELDVNTFLVAEDDAPFNGVVLEDVLKVHAVVSGAIEYETTMGALEVVPALSVVAVEKVGYKDLTGDTVIGAPVWSGYGSMELPITVTNSAAGPMSYSIEVVAESPDGSTQYDSGYVHVDNLNPGQSGTDNAFFMEIPQDAVYRVVSVERRAP
ncbi:hypothetical protein [Microbacterium sp. JZ37]|uniref:hypothetical protein n=1 Tax=Microbacterium sp. JZ37 TaxID=2654193 RepID=UPI002B473272|nr:hypothetical protein [Microbacterium sp. JZ37]WRH16186.1 hypothetical protein GC092_00725 [Microbacterium sp. JZ37]